MHGIQSRSQSVLLKLCFLLLLGPPLLPLTARSEPLLPPDWWANTRALLPGKAPNHAAVAATGQAMHMAKSAWLALNALQGARYAGGQWGRGYQTGELLSRYHRKHAGTPATPLPIPALLQGQLKSITAPFWLRLQALGVAGIPTAPQRPFPWSASLSDDRHSTLALLGQVKAAFSFGLGRSMESSQYLEVIHPVTSIPSRIPFAYLREDFEKRAGTANAVTLGLQGYTVQWRRNGVNLTRESLRGFSLPLTGQPAGGRGFLRLPPVPRESSPLSSVELSITLPSDNAAHPAMSGQDCNHVYIQYRWRAFPDAARSSGIHDSDTSTVENLTGPAGWVANRPGSLVFCDRQDGTSTWPAFRSVGWERQTALISRNSLLDPGYLGAFDLAFPVLTRAQPDQSDPPRLSAHRDYESTGAFNVRSLPNLPGGLPAAGVAGPGWRTTTLRIQLNATEDAMDIWLGNAPLGGRRGAVATGGTGTSPSFATEAYDNPLPERTLSDTRELLLRWNGLRQADFDLAGIYIGFRNPLFANSADLHSGMPARGAGFIPDWMTPWGDDPEFRQDAFTGRRDGNLDWYHLNYAASVPMPRYYHKLDVMRFWQNWQFPETTLPPAWIISTSIPAGPPRSNRGATEAAVPGGIQEAGSSWEDKIDTDRDGLPDNWEMHWFGSLQAQGANGDPDQDSITNIQELDIGVSPLEPLDWNGDADGDGLLNKWELQYGYKLWDGINQALEDPDRDGFNNLMEQKAGTDALVANPTNGPRPGTPPPVSFLPSPPLPIPPPLTGPGSEAWYTPGYDPESTDRDGDGVPDDLDAVPYDSQLTFPRVGEAKYLLVPLTGAGGTPETGVPVAINEAGHILLKPAEPEGGWARYRAPAPSVPPSRPPRLWKTPGTSAVEVPLPPSLPAGYTASWDHANSENDDTLDLDLAEDSGTILAHVRWTNSSGSPHPSTLATVSRTPDLSGRHAFVWNGGTAAPLPWFPTAPLDAAKVPHFLTGPGNPPVYYGDSRLSLAGRLLQGNRISGLRMTYTQKLAHDTSNKESTETFDCFSWTGSTPGQYSLSFTGAISGSGKYTVTLPKENPREYNRPLHDSPGRRIRTLGWSRHAILEDERGRQPSAQEPVQEGSYSISQRERDAANRRAGEPVRSGTKSFYYQKDPWNPGPPLLLPTRDGYHPNALNDFPEGGPSNPDTTPFTSGPMIIGAPGCYWTPSPNDPERMVTGWLYAHPGYEDNERGFFPQDRVPFELSPAARINNQGIVICEDRLWRNGRGHEIKDLIANPTGYSHFELHALNHSGSIAATALHIARNERVPLILLPVEVVELSPKVKDDANIDIAGSDHPSGGRPLSPFVETNPVADRIAHREIRARISKVLKGKTVTWTLDAVPNATPSTIRGQWTHSTTHPDRFETSATYGANGFARLSQASGRTTVGDDGFTAIRVNVPPIGWNQARIRIHIEGTTAPIDLIDMEVPGVVVIDPGHGGTANVSGSNWNNATSPNGVLEKAMALDYGLALRDSLRVIRDTNRLNLRVLVTRDDDSNMSGEDRSAIARDGGADIIHIIHFNASAAHTARGTLEVYRTINNVFPQQDTILSEGIISRVVAAMTPFDAGANQRARVAFNAAVASDENNGNTAAYCPVRTAYIEVEFIDYGAHTTTLDDDLVDILLNIGPNAAAVKTAIVGAMRDGIVHDLRNHQPQP